MDEDNNIIQNNNAVTILQTSQTIQPSDPLQNIEIVNTNHEVTEEICNGNYTNTSGKININLDTLVTNLQSENSKSNIGINNVTTMAYNNIKNAKDLWADDMANVMDYTIEENENIKQNNIICPGSNTGDENHLKSSKIETTLPSNQLNLFDFEEINSSAITPVETFNKTLQKPTCNDSFTGKKFETYVTEEALLEPVATHNNQHFSFEITTSGAENDTGKPMTITINPIKIESKHNVEIENTPITHGKKLKKEQL